MTRVRVESRPFDRVRRKNYAITLLAPLPTKLKNDPVAIAFASNRLPNEVWYRLK